MKPLVWWLLPEDTQVFHLISLSQFTDRRLCSFKKGVLFKKGPATFPHICIYQPPEPSVKSSAATYQGACALGEEGYRIWGQFWTLSGYPCTRAHYFSRSKMSPLIRSNVVWVPQASQSFSETLGTSLLVKRTLRLFPQFTNEEFGNQRNSSFVLWLMEWGKRGAEGNPPPPIVNYHILELSPTPRSWRICGNWFDLISLACAEVLET